MLKWTRTAILLLLTAMLIMTGCGGNNGDNNVNETGNNEANQGADAGGKTDGKDFRIGMVTDTGGVNDNSFNQSAWEGFQKLNEDTGAKVKYLQSEGDADYIPNLSTFVNDGYDLTWGIGYLMWDSIKQVAQQNPDAKLAIIDNVVDAPNVSSVTFAENEGSFLVGVAAAKMTKSNKIGFVGGSEIPVIQRFEAGFRAGIQAVNPDIRLIVNYTGAFDKPDLGKAAASTIYNEGADIIFHASGATGNGVFNEARDRVKGGDQVWVIGVDKDQSLDFGDDITLTSMMKRVDEAVHRVSSDLINGEFNGGEMTVLGLKENGVGLSETSKKNIPDDVWNLVEEYKQKIISGEVSVPQE
ncbi:BMP family lipoprotein [Marinicrinis sediminis]|uniref:BMP family protein n=1 Tax=Marinicrinis sediminis TaxID=1652465 RepID=A0ABW5RE13_9BACL